MGLLPWSFGFLLVITILSWASFGRMTEETIVANTIVDVVQRQALDLTTTISDQSALANDEFLEKMGSPLRASTTKRRRKREQPANEGAPHDNAVASPQNSISRRFFAPMTPKSQLRKKSFEIC